VKFLETRVAGAREVVPEPVFDERGGFARVHCVEEFAAAGLDGHVAQCSVSMNRLRGTLRGMHYQAEPHAEGKLVRVTRGAIYDVALDLRRHSPTYLRWHAVELSADNRRGFAIPAGCAHGFVTLADDTEVMYLISTPYQTDSARGVRYDDPAFGIVWPESIRVISERDAGYPDYLP
jgi:dTDP-4-dehydrorhamnose 3,5-epimerase